MARARVHLLHQRARDRSECTWPSRSVFCTLVVRPRRPRSSRVYAGTYPHCLQSQYSKKSTCETQPLGPGTTRDNEAIPVDGVVGLPARMPLAYIATGAIGRGYRRRARLDRSVLGLGGGLGLGQTLGWKLGLGTVSGLGLGRQSGAIKKLCPCRGCNRGFLFLGGYVGEIFLARGLCHLGRGRPDPSNLCNVQGKRAENK